MGRRVAQFWILWSLLLLVHEGGHALVARHQGMSVEGVTVGVGPALWERDGETRFVLGLVPLAGLTHVEESRSVATAELGRWAVWRRDTLILAGGAAATLALVVSLAGFVRTWERRTGARCRWARIAIADALVLSAFNLLPVPPLDGGRAVLSAVAALRGAQLPPDALFWLQVGGLTLAVVPLAIWTRWTRRIDAIALHWGAPSEATRGS